MRFRFDLKKALQAAAVLLEYEKTRRMSYLRLLKLLYVADRECLAEFGRPITGDQPVALKRGPVLSRVLALIKGEHTEAGECDRWVHKDGYEVELVADPGRGELSRGEVAKLLEVSNRYRELDDCDVVEDTHKFDEWKKNFRGDESAAPIDWSDALTALGKADRAAAIEKAEEQRQFFTALFKGQG
jgi:uncharacterized phage-associated protein